MTEDTAALAHLGALPKIVVNVEPTAADSTPNTEIAEDLLFKIGEGGGTNYRAAHALVMDIVREQFGDAGNRYVFDATDGEPDRS